jgi:hypothetical protein
MKDSLNPLLRDAGRGDFDAILALNAASVQALSPLDHARLEWLHGMRAAHRVVSVNGDVRAFLLAFREGSAYDSPNYRWFAARYPRFLYVDRVVVDAEARGHGLGRLLYEDLITLARSSEVGMICCEYDTEPPNPASAAFHARFGFREVGAERLGPGKAVSLRVLEL